MLVVIVGCVDGRKAVVSVEPGARESADTWSRVLRDRRLRAPKPVVAGSTPGVEEAVRNR